MVQEKRKKRKQQSQTLPSFRGVEPLDTQFIAHGDIRRHSSICSGRYFARFSDVECVLPFAPVIPFLGLSCSEIKTIAAPCSELLIPVEALFVFFRGLTVDTWSVCETQVLHAMQLLSSQESSC